MDIFCSWERLSIWHGTLQKDKRFKALQIYLEILARLKEFRIANDQVTFEEIDFVLTLFEKLKSYLEMFKGQDFNNRFRPLPLIEFNEFESLFKDLHDAFAILRKVPKIPEKTLRLLYIPELDKMNKLKLKWLHWQVYTYWLDEYVYIFDGWRLNPSDFEKMKEQLFAAVWMIHFQYNPNEFILPEKMIMCEREEMRLISGVII